MSFILDALQRADAQRERGAVPGLHARQAISPLNAVEHGSRKGMGLAVVGLLALALAAAISWMSLGNPPVVVVTPVPMPAPAQPPKPAPLASRSLPQLPSSAAKVPASPAREVIATAATTVPLLGELPEDIRRQIPAMGITGAVYSENPAQRLLLVNGQVLGQGSLAASDVLLVEIGSKYSEFSFRGTRFRVAH
jgi:general secretion pathway protein B